MIEDQKPAESPKFPAYPEPVESQHTLTLTDRTLTYTVKAGTLPLNNTDTGETEAHVFYIAYTLDTDEADRPLTIAYNGGPGSSSIWLHLGALGPRRVQLNDDGSMPAPPYRLVDNPHTWLAFTDLVFVDPVGTGYSRAVRSDLNSKYWSVNGDLDAMGEFIRLYLTRSRRWGSPLFLAGESYGTTRSAGLAGKLIDQGIAFNGILLISTVINFQSLIFMQGNDLPSLVYIPSYAAAAWYHKQLPADLQALSLADLLTEVEAWVETEYNNVLLKGDSLPSARKRAAITRLARYTGLSRSYIEMSNLRIEINRFCKELLRTSNQCTIGRLDSRLYGREIDTVADAPEFDPSYAAILPPYTTMLNRYLGQEIGYKMDMEYRALAYKVYESWSWGSSIEGYPDTSRLLSAAFARNPHLKVFLAQGYYDLATPYYAAYYSLSHMGLDAAAHSNIRTAEYEAGHMMYIESDSLVKLSHDVASFYMFALA